MGRLNGKGMERVNVKKKLQNAEEVILVGDSLSLVLSVFMVPGWMS